MDKLGKSTRVLGGPYYYDNKGDTQCTDGSEREYYNRRANLKSSTSNLFLYANNFNNQLQENLSLIQSQDPDKQGSGGMAFQMALVQRCFHATFCRATFLLVDLVLPIGCACLCSCAVRFCA